jgi:UDP-3-O-[3-hydroxymyristoyl] glucosamine N-acyltransferase
VYIEKEEFTIEAVVESANIGDGTRIWHFAHVREEAKIGENCNL